MIDPSTGNLLLSSGEKLQPSTSLESFLESALARAAEKERGGEGWLNIKLEPKFLGEFSVIITVQFFYSSLREIHIYFNAEDGDGSSWSDWSEEVELRRKKMQASWLDSVLAPSQRSFDWGEVISVYDAKSGFSEVLIRYV